MKRQRSDNGRRAWPLCNPVSPLGYSATDLTTSRDPSPPIRLDTSRRQGCWRADYMSRLCVIRTQKKGNCNPLHCSQKNSDYWQDYSFKMNHRLKRTSMLRYFKLRHDTTTNRRVKQRPEASTSPGFHTLSCSVSDLQTKERRRGSRHGNSTDCG